MRHAIASLLIWLTLAVMAAAEDRPQGLLWNRSGLAATLPLQVKTDGGADYLMRLRDSETDRIVLAAYIRGGEHFRVLVPPGRFELLFALGTTWYGEDVLFGSDTRTFILDDALDFGATVSRKHGHLVDLREEADLVVRDFVFCQRLAREFEVERDRRPHAGRPFDHSTYPGRRLAQHAPYVGGVPSYDPRYARDGWYLHPYLDIERPLRPVEQSYDLRARVCD